MCIFKAAQGKFSLKMSRLREADVRFLRQAVRFDPVVYFVQHQPPLAGVIIAVSGAVGITPVALIRCTFPPMTVAIVVMMTCNFIFGG